MQLPKWQKRKVKEEEKQQSESCQVRPINQTLETNGMGKGYFCLQGHGTPRHEDETHRDADREIDTGTKLTGGKVKL